MRLADDVKDALRAHGTLLTGFAVTLILGTGLTLQENPGYWREAGLAITASCLLLFLLLNARVVIKASLAILLVLMGAAMAFRTGILFDSSGLAGDAWMLSIFFSFSLCLALSYVLPSGQGRWGTLIVAGAAGFMLAYAALALTGSAFLAAVVSSVVGTSFFLVLYLLGRRSLFSRKIFPVTGMSDEMYDAFRSSASAAGWGVSPIIRRKRLLGALAWDDKHAFAVTPVELEAAFAEGGRRKKKTYLTYKQRDIAPWLMSLIFRVVPVRRTARADIMLVLLDTTGINGKEPRVIGVPVPDSKKKLPVGIVPARRAVAGGDWAPVMETARREFSKFTKELSEKQLYLLDMRLPLEADRDAVRDADA